MCVDIYKGFYFSGTVYREILAIIRVAYLII